MEREYSCERRICPAEQRRTAVHQIHTGSLTKLYLAILINTGWMGGVTVFNGKQQNVFDHIGKIIPELNIQKVVLLLQ